MGNCRGYWSFSFNGNILIVRFVYDTVNVCYLAWKHNKCRHYSISNKKHYSILEVAKMFKRKIKYLPVRKGERYASALTKMYLSKKVYQLYGDLQLKNYIKNITK